MAKPLWPNISTREWGCAEQTDPPILDQQPWQSQIAEDAGLRAFGKWNSESDVDDLSPIRTKEPVRG